MQQIYNRKIPIVCDKYKIDIYRQRIFFDSIYRFKK